MTMPIALAHKNVLQAKVESLWKKMATKLFILELFRNENRKVNTRDLV